MHGYRGSRLTMLKHALVLNMQGFTVLSFDFQAHGRSGGKRVTLGWLERRDAEAAMLYMRTMYPAEKLGIVAVSMGGAAAVVGQAKKIASAMVLEQVYPRLDRAVLNRFGPVLGHAFLVQVPLRLGFRPSSLAPIDCIKDYAKPLLLLAGSADTGTPPSETQALFAAANAPKELVVFDGAGHECLLEKDPALWLSKVLPFLEEHLGQSVT
jgi:alpha-beta hydrolase superfamily lysophospholipase